MAQVRIVLAYPHQISSGSLSMDFDPAVFAPIAAVDVFSSTGDQFGVANISDRHVDAQFSSPSGGIGRFPGMPAITVEVPVLASAKPGVLGSITFANGKTPWSDVHGYQYLPVGPSASLKVGGALAIDSVSPGGGLLPAGFTVRIAGQGFAPLTTLQIEGVALDSTTFVGPQEIDATLGAPADLTAKRVVVENPDGTTADFYSALRGMVPETSPGLVIQPIFPLETYAGADIGLAWFAVQNQNPEPVDVTFVTTTLLLEGGSSTRSSTVSLPAYGILSGGPNYNIYGNSTDTAIYPAAPIRMTILGGSGMFSGDELLLDESPGLVSSAVLELNVAWQNGPPACTGGPPIGVFTPPICLAWLIGSSPPASQVLTVSSSGPTTSFVAAVTTTDGGQWLSVSPTQGTTCLSGATTCTGSNVTLTFYPQSLKPGNYPATLTITPAAPIYLPLTIPLMFRVTTAIISVEGPSFLTFATDSNGNPPPPQTLQVTSTGDDRAPFSVSLSISQQIWGNWVSVTPMQGITPATLTVTANPSALLPAASGAALGYITVSGPANSVTSSVMLILPQKLPPPAMYTSAGNTPLVFWAQAGTTTPASQLVNVWPFLPDSVEVKTDRGADWLSAPIVVDIDNNQDLSVTVNPTGLVAGTYHGTITAASTTNPTYAPTTIAVLLNIWAAPPPISVTPAALVFSVPSGSATGYDPSLDQTLTVTSGGTPVDPNVSIATTDGNNWLVTIPPFYLSTSLGVTLGINAQNLPPGKYEGSVTITAPPGSPNSVTVPVTLNVTPALPPLPQAGPPFGASIVNGASETVGAVAPGEVVSIFGLNIGPSTPATMQLDSSGKVATDLQGAQVLFGGIPAPLLYASATQVTAVVPYEVAGDASVNVQVEFNGATVPVAGVPVAPTAPAIFSLDGTGVGQANAFNADNSANSAANPAARGSLISLLATGVGQTKPASSTGEIINNVQTPILPVSVEIGNVQATVVNTQSALGQVAGIIQLQVLVPPGVKPGPGLPVVLTVGSVPSPEGVTIAVR